MVSLFSIPQNGRVFDPCFGGGVFIDALTNQGSYHVVGNEIDKSAYASYNFCKEYKVELYNRDFFSFADEEFDGIIMNPPYVRQEEIDKMRPLGITKEYLRNICSGFDVPLQSNLYVYFILHSISLLKDGGELVVIFPNSWMKAQNGSFLLESLNAHGSVESMIEVKGNPFEGNPLVEVVILKFVKNRKILTSNWVIDVNKEEILPVAKEQEVICFDYEKLTYLKNIFTSKRGLTTFFNEAFINPKIFDNTHFQSIISSPKDIPGYRTENAHTDNLLMLNSLEGISDEVRQYISDIEQYIISEGKPQTLLSRLQNGQPWYILNAQEPPVIVFPYIIRHLPRFIYNDRTLIVRDNFYCIYSECNPFLLLALLNNYFVFYQLEQCGKRYGNGILKIQKYDLENLLLPNFDYIEDEHKSLLTQLGEKLAFSGDKKIISDITEILKNIYGFIDIESRYIDAYHTRLNLSHE